LTDIDAIKRNIAIAQRAQREIEERNPDYIEERGADVKKWHDLDMNLIELEDKLLKQKPRHGGNRPGAGRPFGHGEPTTSVQIRMPNSLLASINEAAAEKDISRNQIIVMSIKYAINAYAGEKFDEWAKEEAAKRAKSQQ
jgi:hypothetical protein